MITKKLNELGEYIDEINGIKPIDLLETNMNIIEKELEDLKSRDLELGKIFNKDIIKLIEEYRKKGLVKAVIICELYNILINFSRKNIIENKAVLLGIDSKMFKNEMNLLFKGKKIV